MKTYRITAGLFLSLFIIFAACRDASLINNSSSDETGIGSVSDSAAYFRGINRKIETFRKRGGIFDIAGRLTIDIGDEYVGHYEIYHYSEKSNDKILAGYNNTRHLLELIDLGTQNIYASIPFEKEGPNGVRNITGIFYHNKDSIFVTSDFHLLLLNEHGETKLKIRINQPDEYPLEGIDFSEYYFSPWKDKPIYFYAPHQALIVPVHSAKYSQWTVPQYFESPICAKILLEDRKVELLPLFYPNEYRKYSYGFSNKVFFTYNREKVIAGFTNSPKLVVYDLEKKESSTHNCKSRFDRKMLPYTGLQGDDQAMIEHLDQNTQFMSLHYNSFKNRYYLTSGFMEEDFPGLKFNLTVINEEFETLCELTLPPYFPPIGMFSTLDGLAFRDFQQSSGRQAIYNLVDIDCR